MVAYSFQRRFVDSVIRGLQFDPDQKGAAPKRQTIRADRRRHARPGEKLQLYCGMRTKGCFLIGEARCTEVVPIALNIRNDHLIAVLGWGDWSKQKYFKVTNEFAQADGFNDAEDMHDFWIEQHGDPYKYGSLFEGVIIKWEPI